MLKTKRLTIGLIVLAILSGGFFMARIAQQYMVDHYPIRFADSDATVRQLKRTPQPDGVLMFYQPGCSDCKSVESLIVGHDMQSKPRLYMLNTKNANVKPYIRQYDVVSTPTFIEMRGGKIIDRYSGTNQKTIRKFLN